MFKIGEFSTIARVSDVTLRHYDAINLFKPIYVDPETGYRYYSIDQLSTLNRILALRDLGLSLQQVARLVADDISAEEIQGMLKLQQAQIEDTLKEEHARLRRVSSRLKQVQQHGVLPGPDIVIKRIAQQHFLSIREPVPYLRQSGWLYWQVSTAVYEAEVPGVSYCMAVFHDPVFRTRNTDFELGFLLDKYRDLQVALPEGRVLQVKTLDPVPQAMTCVHAGPWSEIHHGFAAIGAYMETNQLRIAGRPREVYLNLVPPEEDDQLVIEIQIPVEAT